jgi:DNA-binding response OmpR family regulator
VKILLVDDDDELRAILGFALRQAGWLALEARTGDEMLRVLAADEPALVVLDLNLGREDGLDLLPRIRDLSRAPVLVLSVRSSEEDVVRALDLGADDHLAKPFSPRTLLARVRALVRRGRGGAPAEPTVVGPYRLDVDRRTLSIEDAPSVRLTPLELRLVQILLAQAGEAVGAERLIAHVWGARGYGDRQLLKQLVHRLRQKVEGDPAAPRWLETEASSGYRLRLDPASRPIS